MWPFRRHHKAQEPVLRGTPPVRRVKYYSADTGHTYRYWYRGWREDGPSTLEYSFEIRCGREDALTAYVRVPRSHLATCEAAIGRELTSSERYAIVKLALFQAFDESRDIQQPIVPAALEMIESLQRLGCV